MFEDDGQFPPLAPRDERSDLGEVARLAAQRDVESFYADHRMSADRSTFASLLKGGRRPLSGEMAECHDVPDPLVAVPWESGRVEITDKGREALAEESEAMRFLRHRNELSGRLSLIEQAYWIRNRDEQQDTSSAQPHRFRSAE